MDLDLEGGETLVYGLKEEINIPELIEMYRPLQPYQQYKNLNDDQQEALKGWCPWIKGEIDYFKLKEDIPTIEDGAPDELKQLHKKWAELYDEYVTYRLVAATKAKTKKSKKSKSKSPP